MKSIFYTIILLIVTQISQAQIKFTNNNDNVRVYKGNAITIEADTAFIISKSRARYLNQKLNELDTIKSLYNDLVDNRNELLKSLSDAQVAVNKIIAKLEKDSSAINQKMSMLIADFDKTLTELKENNEKLKQNNAELASKINKLEKIIKELNTENRWIWWNGMTDKIVVFAGGVGVGILIMALL